ncbi:MAG: phosphoribosylamine--glycine ligase [Defluviitaleaceae bacterium]|nr:phosphoribosylamine--glycine ligase [Defluviitaleaceae bacterium]
MKVLIIGSGGRESAMVWKISKSKLSPKIYAAPGNPGMEGLAELVNIAATDIHALLEFAVNEKIDFTIVGPDDPLALGVVDVFEEKGLKIFGPRKNAAIIEYSKEFSKDFMKRNNIPTAAYEVFEDKDKAYAYIEKQKFPIVIKADGLALGKGVYICGDLTESRLAVQDIMELSKFGDSGKKIVVEEYLEGVEVSVLSFVDGKTVVPMISAKDHKRAFDGDKGANTGGMGAVAPNPIYDEEMANRCMDEIFAPTVAAMAKEDREFKGFLFFGLMITKNGPKVIEYNARLGDPETQVVLPMLESDFLKICIDCLDGSLDKADIRWKEGASVCVVLASEGYPAEFKKGFEIKGLSLIEEKEDIFIFTAGVKKENERFLTNGGRVLGVAAMADNSLEAANKAYAYAEHIVFENKYCRKDIGRK